LLYAAEYVCVNRGTRQVIMIALILALAAGNVAQFAAGRHHEHRLSCGQAESRYLDLDGFAPMDRHAKQVHADYVDACHLYDR
jgi:uncharacterized cupin superfamily protein